MSIAQPRSALAVIGLCVLCAVLVRGVFAGPPNAHGGGIFSAPIDFIAFRCAGRVVAAGADPYRTEPLRACERATYAEAHRAMVRNLVVPAPLPPYALVAFAPFSALPLSAALGLWYALLVAAFAATCALLASLTRAPPWLVTAALLPADLLASALAGQLVPLVLCAMCASAAALRAKRYAPAALLALATLLEPHLGIPLCAGLAAYERRTLVALAAGGTALCGLSLLGGGVARNLEYGLAVLPAHAAAEVHAFNAQYGLSALFVATGVAERTALVCGTLAYVALLVAGLWLGKRLARTTGDGSFALFVPVAAVLVGGPFWHIHQMAAALPLVLLLGGARPWRQPLLLLALACLAVPWQSLAELLPPASGGAGTPRPGAVDRVLLGFGDGSRLAEDAWGAWERAHPYDRRSGAEIVLIKVPTWLGLALLALATVRCGRGLRQAACTGRVAPKLRSLSR